MLAVSDEKETVLAAARARNAAGELFAKTTAGPLAEARPRGEEHVEHVEGFLTDIDEEPVEAPHEDAVDGFDVWCGAAYAPDTPEAEAEDANVESALAPVAADADPAPAVADADPAVRMMDRLLAFRIVYGCGLRRHQQRPACG